MEFVQTALDQGSWVWTPLAVACLCFVASIFAAVASARGKPWPSTAAVALVAVPFIAVVLATQLSISNVRAAIDAPARDSLAALMPGVVAALFLQLISFWLVLAPTSALCIGAMIGSLRGRRSSSHRWLLVPPLGLLLVSTTVLHGFYCGGLLYSIIPSTVYLCVVATICVTLSGTPAPQFSNATTAVGIALVLLISAGELAASADNYLSLFTTMATMGNASPDIINEAIADIQRHRTWLIVAVLAGLLWLAGDTICARRQGQTWRHILLPLIWLLVVPATSALPDTGDVLTWLTTTVQVEPTQPIQLP